MLVFASQLLSFSESKELLYSSYYLNFLIQHYYIALGVIAFNFFLCQYLFISSVFFLLREAFDSGSEVTIGLTFILCFFFLSLSVFFKATYFAEFSVFWRFLHSLTFSLVCSFFFLTLSASWSATLSGLLCRSDDFLLSSAKQLLLYNIYGLAQCKQVACMKVIC